MGKPGCLVICVGKDCRRSSGFDELCADARRLDGVEQVPCQDLCHGPIVGLRIDGELRWYHRIRKHKHRAALVRAAADGRFVGALHDLEVRKRRNLLRHASKVRRLRAA
jgi:hypothetical protein